VRRRIKGRSVEGKIDRRMKGVAMDELARQILKDVALEEIAPKAQKRSPVDHWSSPVLLERAAYLKKLAQYGDGSASETLREYPGHQAMLILRSRDGEAELHDGSAFLFCVLAGAATLVTGGTVTPARRVGPGEIRGDSLEGGARQQLRAGDVAHVPAGTAHQILVAAEKPIACFVVKIQEAG
jgi:mannose-6-phosphate isomerase-like protein (cupin superfamily)